MQGDTGEHSGTQGNAWKYRGIKDNKGKQRNTGEYKGIHDYNKI